MQQDFFLAMAVTVDPFSFATAELSDDYISVFSHPEIVPRYLEKVRNWTGVEVKTGVGSIGIKGSWVSLNRVHLFLTEFLVSYQNEAVKQEETYQEKALKQEEKKDVDLFEQGQCFSDHDTDDIDNSDSIEIEEPNPVPNNETRFHDNSAESSDWFKWTAEVLPQIQRTRSKKAQIYSEPQTKDKIPEPLVFCANYQPTPDPAARKPPTLDAIEKVLKTVYDRVKLSGSSDASEEHVADIEYNCSRERSKEKDGKDMGLQSNENNLSGLSVPFLVDSSSRKEDCTKPDGPTHNNNAHSIPEDSQAVSHSELTNSTLSSNVDSDVDPKMVLPQLLHTNTGSHVTAVKEKSTNGESKAQMTRRSNRKRKRLPRTENNDDIQDAIPVKNPVFRKFDPKHVQDESYPEKAVSTKDYEEPTVVRKTRRKGQPQKKINYQKKVSELESPGMSVSHLSGVNRSRKCRNKIAVSEDDPVKKSDGRAQIRQKALKEDGCKDYVCELCAYVTKKLSQLREHKRRVHITKEFKCDKCGKVFGFGKDLKRHYLTHQKAENCCDICGKMYKGIRTLAEHKKTHERNYIKPEFPCEFCQKIFSTKYVLAYHIKSEHLGIKKTFLCPTCGKSFSQRNSYLQHANVHMGIKPYRCDTCGRSFSYEKSLKEHKYMHESDKQFECHVCHKKFRQSSGVAIHMKIHKEHKDYVCAACGKGFSQKQALIRHERIHRGEKPFSCALCKRTFTDSSILRRHMILIHKKDKNKWKEDTQNNVQRRTDFFISVTGKDGKTKNSEEEVLDQTESVKFDQFERKSIKVPDCDPILMRDIEGGVVDSCSAEIMDESFNFLPVDVGSMPSLPPSTLPEIPVPAVPTAMPAPILPQVKANHLLSESSSNINTLSAFTNLNTQTMSVSAALKQASSAAKTALDSSIGIGSALSPSSEPVDMSSQNQVPVHFNAHSSSVLSSYSLNDSQDISSSELCPNNLQQDGVPFSAVMTPGTSAYQSVVLMMSDALNPLSFPSAAINNSVTTDFHDQPADYDR